MNLKHLTDDELISQTIAQADVARNETTKLLHFLCELDRRKAYAKYSVSSLFEFCVEVLKFDHPEAARRVNAARAMSEFPEIEEKINSGTLSMTSVSQAQVFFKQEARANNKLSKEEKREILEKIEDKSTRQTERILLSHSSQPEKAIKEAIRPVSDSMSIGTLPFDNETLAYIERLSEIWSHAMPGASKSEVIKRALKECLKQVDPKIKAERAMKRKEKSFAKDGSIDQVGSSRIPSDQFTLTSDEVTASKTAAVSPAPYLKYKQTRYISATVQHHVWWRDGGSCTYRDPVTGLRCCSRHFVQLDHIIPFAKGGSNEADNLRLRCRAHNMWYAIQVYGEKVLSVALD